MACVVRHGASVVFDATARRRHVASLRSVRASPSARRTTGHAGVHVSASGATSDGEVASSGGRRSGVMTPGVMMGRGGWLARPRGGRALAGRGGDRVEIVARGIGDGAEGSLLDELDADQRCPVPKDQRPASQLRECQESALVGWGALELKWYLARLGALGAFFYVVVAYPIASYSYNPETQPVEAVICATVGALTATAAFALLIYNNWSYVRGRLLSATVEYEETGWYDGQVYVKDPEMLARDRLLGTYTVGPIVERLRKTLLACGAGVFVSLAALNTIDAPEYGVEKQQYGGGGAGFYVESSAVKYEPQTAEEEEEEEREELARYEAAMARFQRDNEAAAATTTTE